MGGIQVTVPGTFTGTLSGEISSLAGEANSPILGGVGARADGDVEYDLSDNFLTDQASFQLTLADATPPDAPVILGIQEDTGIPGNNITSDNTLIYSGEAEPLSTVEVFVDGIPAGTTETNLFGDWELDDSARILSNGGHQITAIATDRAGNTSTLSTAFDIVVLTFGKLPLAVDDSLSFSQKISVVSGNLITGVPPTTGGIGGVDDQGDGPARVHSIFVSGTIYDIPDGGSVTVEVIGFGELTVNSNGDYTFDGRGDKPSLPSDTVVYEIVDQDGDTSIADLTVGFFDNIDNIDPDAPVLNGTNDDDALFGDADDQRINAKSGNDLVDGKGGNDVIEGKDDNDTLYGGAGLDIIDGGKDDDVIYGGPGGDDIVSGNGNDIIFGQDGDDQIILDGADNELNSAFGGEGDDIIQVAGNSDSENRLEGEAGDDTLIGGAGDDLLHGGVGSDILVGGQGSDVFLFEGDDIGALKGVDIIGEETDLFGTRSDMGRLMPLDGDDILRFENVFDVPVDPLNLVDFFELDVNADGTLVSINRDGAGTDFEAVVQINDYFNTDLETFYTLVEIA